MYTRLHILYDLTHQCLSRRLYNDKKPSGPVADLYINQLVSSTLTWPQQGLSLTQTATVHGPSNTALTKIEFTTDSRTDSGTDSGTDMIVVKLRIPSWVTEGMSEVGKLLSPFADAQARMA